MGKRRGNPCYGRVTNMAGLRGWNMTGPLAYSGYAVVTTGARSYNLRMVDSHGRAPQAGAMARFADVTRCNMVQRFSGGVDAVVTPCTTVGNSSVIEGGAGPTGGVVATVAGGGRCDMSGSFTARDRAVVTTRAGSVDLGVINACSRLPQRRTVTILAEIGRRNMRR